MTLYISRVDIDPGDPATVNVVFADNTVSGGGYDMQVAINPDFAFCVCPIFYLGGNPGTYLMRGVNPGTTLYARVRNRAADGTVYPWSPTYAFRTGPSPFVRQLAPAPVMIEPATFVLPERIMSAASGNTKLGFPAMNLARADTTAFRMGEMGSNLYYFEIEIGGAPIDTIAMLNTNIPDGATWYVDAGDVPIRLVSDVKYAVAARPFRASPSLPGRPGYHGMIRLPVAQSWRWWRIIVQDAPITGSILHAQHLVVGLNRVTKNHSVDKTETPTPLTTIERKRSGVFDRVAGLPMRKVEFELSMLTEMQYETVYGDLWRYENEPAFVVPNSKAGAFLHDRMLFGDLSGGRTLNPYSPRYSRQFAVNSLI